MLDGKAFGEQIVAEVRGFVARQFGQLETRIKQLEDRPAPERGERGEPGARGEAGLPGERGEKGDAGELGPQGDRGEAGASGEPGEPGQSAYELAVAHGFTGTEAQYLTSLRGADGRDGVNGAPGENGRDGKDGAPGERGPIGPAGERGEIGEPGAPGADGKSVTAEDFRQMFEAEYAKWQLEWERRANDRLDCAVAALPKPQDGFSLEDFVVEHDGEGNVTLRFARGDLQKEFKLRIPRFKDRGGYRDGESYLQGDGVTYGGSYWISQKDQPEGRPDSGGADWRLAVKKGRDGKDGGPAIAPAAREVVKTR